VTKLQILSDEVECRCWMESVFLRLTHHDVMQRVSEVDALLGRLDPTAKATWRNNELMKLTVENNGFRLSSDALKRVERLLARGEATPFGRVLKKRGISHDHRLQWLIHEHARPTTSEILE
jgi:hypothetical protein